MPKARQGSRIDGPAGRRAERGYTLAEVVMVVALIALMTTISLFGWQTIRQRSHMTAASRLTRSFIYEARMMSIYRGVNHFVVIDQNGGTIRIHEDSGSVPGSFDDGDKQVTAAELPAGVKIELPVDPAELPSPLDGSILTDAWSLPQPDPTARWGSDLKGLMTTPTGLIESAEDSPSVVGNGVIVFSDRFDNVSAVGIRGATGSVRAFEYVDGAWKEL
ncbi:MAG: prepilin-type N-terminal cleavage/methylation domain-containing protein [Acidobacteria bacterium]|nr:MAG: prepilin-type N-terminal cleavage/methylation domain-containing protein [Acidobacteriota bacterium]